MRAAITFVIVLLATAVAAAQAVDQDGLYRDPFLVVDPGMHTAQIWRLDGDAAGRFLVTGSIDKTVRVWSAEDGRLQRTIRVPTGPGNGG
jgi:WD40 repeat protein